MSDDYRDDDNTAPVDLALHEEDDAVDGAVEGVEDEVLDTNTGDAEEDTSFDLYDDGLNENGEYSY